MAYIPLGYEFRVNTQYDGDQFESDIAVLDDGTFIVVWTETRGLAGDTSGDSIRAQRYAAGGAAIGGEFQINAQAIGDQLKPNVSPIDGGGFVVSWTDASGISDGDNGGVVAQMFDAAANKIGNEFVVNTQTVSAQSFSMVARLTSGGFVVTWSDFVNQDIKAQVYAAGGAAVGGELTVNTQMSGLQEKPRVTGLSNGGFVIVWEDDGGTLGQQETTKVQMYDATGTRIGGEFLVNATTAGDQRGADVAALPGGRFVVSWSDSNDGGNIKAQLFDATGAKVGGEFTVNTTTGGQGGQVGPSVSPLADGGFLIAWTDVRVVGGFDTVVDGEVRAQAFDAAGTKIGSEIHLNTLTNGGEVVAASAGLKNGGFAVVWASTGSSPLGDLGGFSVAARLFQHPLGDFNGDGNSDILWRDTSGFVAQWQMNGTQIVSNTGVAAPGNEWKFQDTGDFGGDGLSDVLWRHTSGQVVLWQMNGDQIVSNTSIQTVSNDYHVQGVADFNGDGKSDVLWRHDSGQVVLWQMNGDTILSNTAIDVPSRQYHIEGVGDFGGDGKSDVLFRHDGGQVVLWQMDGDKIGTNTAVGEVAQQYHVQGIGDFNGDGKSDVLWRHDSGQVVLWQMNGDKVISNTAIANVSNDYKVADVHDYNGDGISDVLWRHDSGQVVLWQLNGDKVASTNAIATIPNNWVIQAHHFDLL